MTATKDGLVSCKLGISRVELIESDASHYSETRAWALALHDQCPVGEGLTWASHQADPARATVLFGDRLAAAALIPKHRPISLLQPDGSAISEIIGLAQRLGVLLTP